MYIRKNRHIIQTDRDGYTPPGQPPIGCFRGLVDSVLGFYAQSQSAFSVVELFFDGKGVWIWISHPHPILGKRDPMRYTHNCHFTLQEDNEVL